MGRAEQVKPNFPRDAFAGTADYYVRYRVPYSGRLLRDLVDRAGITGAGRLLDLACGPGRLALALASSFQEIWAVDLEPEMVEAGRRQAALRGVEKIKWIEGRGEDLDAPPASFELVAIGEAFHRLDQQLMATQILRWLKPGGHLATLGCYSILSGREPWQQLVLGIVRSSTGQELKECGSAGRPTTGRGPEHDERVLRDAGFAEVASYPFVEPHEWTVDAILGYLYSTSVCSKRVLGSEAESFEARLKAALLAHDAAGIFRENIQWGYTIGSKPH
jgi:SAM-dependent methyltransferase